MNTFAELRALVGDAVAQVLSDGEPRAVDVQAFLRENVAASLVSLERVIASETWGRRVEGYVTSANGTTFVVVRRRWSP